MIRSASRLFALALLLALPVLSACGGTTGFEVRVDTPADLVAGTDFDNLRVQVDSDSKSQATTVPISKATAKPYRIYVFNDGEHLTATLRVFLLKQGEIKKEAVKSGEPFVSGELKTVVVDFN